jgi:hypothetical protein
MSVQRSIPPAVWVVAVIWGLLAALTLVAVGLTRGPRPIAAGVLLVAAIATGVGLGVRAYQRLRTATFAGSGGDDGGEGGEPSGVREPRQPAPDSGEAAAALGLPDPSGDQHGTGRFVGRWGEREERGGASEQM